MHLLTLDDPEWVTTFPRRVAPLPDEWLGGLLLRCDEVNSWPSGTTLINLFHSSSSNTLVAVPDSILEDLAQLLAISRSTLLVTTYESELMHLYGILKPPAKLLSRPARFRFCPACVSENRILKRTLMLAHLMACPQHQVTFVSTCPCGNAQRLFSVRTLPFTCDRCGLDWRQFPQSPVHPERLALEQRLLSWYEFFFCNGTPTLLTKAAEMIHEVVTRNGSTPLRRLDGRIIRSTAPYYAGYPGRFALGNLVDLLVSLDLFPHDLAIDDPPVSYQ